MTAHSHAHGDACGCPGPADHAPPLQLVPPPLALYVHLPWCVRKCPYCDFNSHAAKGALPFDAYVDALVRDLDQDLPLVWGRVVNSVFFGGGTPSLFPPEAIDRFLQAASARLRFAPNLEVTLETNPGTAEHGRFDRYRAAGVNRISFGIQSFDDAALQRLGRIHDSAEAERAVKLAQGIPDEDGAWDIQEHCQALLAAAGYGQYEVSAYARDGWQCAHNLNYWRFGDYLGIGAGAHGKISSGAGQHVLRRWKHKHPQTFMDSAGTPAAIGGDDIIDAARLPFEYMLNLLRLHEGFGLRDFESRTGLERGVLQPALATAVERGWLLVEGGRVTPTELGRRFTNDVVELFLP
jgi:oxygen-independent coproporphyrinogen-3 oxidase